MLLLLVLVGLWILLDSAEMTVEQIVNLALDKGIAIVFALILLLRVDPLLRALLAGQGALLAAVMKMHGCIDDLRQELREQRDTRRDR